MVGRIKKEPVGTEFTLLYVDFIEKLGKIIDDRLKSDNYDSKHEKEPAGNKISDLISELTNGYARVCIDFAASQIEPSIRENLIFEMDYFLSLGSDDQGPEKGDAVKGSIEKFLDKWVADWIKSKWVILNELLKLSRPV